MPCGLLVLLALILPNLLATTRAAPAIDPWPLEDVVAQAQRFAYAAPQPTPTGATRQLYLETIAGTVLHFRQFQNKVVWSVGLRLRCQSLHATST